MTKELKKGDKVEWGTSQGKTNGTVEKKQTTETHIKSHKGLPRRTTRNISSRATNQARRPRISPRS
jgi:hypothetical protein